MARIHICVTFSIPRTNFGSMEFERYNWNSLRKLNKWFEVLCSWWDCMTPFGPNIFKVKVILVGRFASKNTVLSRSFVVQMWTRMFLHMRMKKRAYFCVLSGAACLPTGIVRRIHAFWLVYPIVSPQKHNKELVSGNYLSLASNYWLTNCIYSCITFAYLSSVYLLF